MLLDVIFLAHNRLEFTKFSLRYLLANTDWSLVNRLVIYDDDSTDGTYEYVMQEAEPQATELVNTYTIPTHFHSPTAIMRHYVENFDSDYFAKVDNDVVMPLGWLNDMASAIAGHPNLDALGAEAGFTELQPVSWENGSCCYEPATHIGGVGIIKSSIFVGRPIQANGRFGWTEWQHNHNPVRGWIKPNIRITTLDRVPFEPWVSLSQEYVTRGWQRPSSKYSEDMHAYWDWWK